MAQTTNDSLRYELGPGHETVTLDTLPAPDTTRWVARRKAQVLGAVELGLLSIDEACSRYRLSVEEFVSWHRAAYRHGVQGLKATRSNLKELRKGRRVRQLQGGDQPRADATPG